MIAKVNQTSSIEDSFSYARAVGAEEKGGQLIRSNVLSEWMPIDTQKEVLKNLCSPKFKVPAITIILSHSVHDKELLKMNERLKKKYIGDFLDECRKQGIDIDNAPWAIMEHHNTDCLHYHMLLLTTRFDRSRLNTAFIGKKATKAAYLASKKNGLHYAAGAERREMARLRFLSDNQKSDSSQSTSDTEKLMRKIKKNTDTLQHTIAENQKYEEKKRRQRAAQERKERLAKIKAQIESDAIRCRTISELIKKAEGRGYQLVHDKKWYLLVPDKAGEKMLKYSLEKSLKVNMDRIHLLERNERYDKAKEMAEKLHPGINEWQKKVAAYLFLGETEYAAAYARNNGFDLSLPKGWTIDNIAEGTVAIMQMCVDIVTKPFEINLNNGGYGSGVGNVDTSKKKKSKDELAKEAKSKGYSR